jgi:hypothetical protein
MSVSLCEGEALVEEVTFRRTSMAKLERSGFSRTTNDRSA